MVDSSSPDVKYKANVELPSEELTEASDGAALPAHHEERFALGHLSIEDELPSVNSVAETVSVGTAAIPAPVRTTVAQVEEGGEELHFVSAQTLEPKVGAGTELLQSLDAIPDKMAFKIGEAAEMVGVKQYVLRYWESEFEMLRPRKSKNNQRVYSRRDVETAMMIKKLLYEDRFSIEGARAALKQLKSQVKEEKSIKALAQTQESAVTKLRAIAAEIRRIRAIFS